MMLTFKKQGDVNCAKNFSPKKYVKKACIILNARLIYYI